MCILLSLGTHKNYMNVLYFAGGILANSLAIATDAAHLFTDLASFMISLFAIYLASRPATKRMSFGWHRAGNFIYTVTPPPAPGTHHGQ